MLGDLRTLGQRPGTYDCGYFAGYSLSLVHRYGDGAGTAPFREDDVYNARNQYLDKFGGGGFAGPLRDAYRAINAADHMQKYLEVLGCGNKYTFRYHSSLKDPQLLRRLLIDAVPKIGARHGVLLAIGSIAMGHWICVLGYGVANEAATLPTLRRGVTSPNVTMLQEALNQLARPHQQQLVADGIFGMNTDMRVREFQQLSHIGVDGIVGRETWGELDRQLGGSGNQELFHIYDPYQTSSQYLFGFSLEEFVVQLSRRGLSLLVSQGNGAGG